MSVDSNSNTELKHFEDVSLNYQGLTQEDVDNSPPHKIGRPRYIPCKAHYDIVRALCLFGAPHDYIAPYIGITPKTLRKYYPELLKNCKENKNYSVESSLFIQALRGNVDACKYWLDNHLKDKYNRNPVPSEPTDDNSDIMATIYENLPD